MAWLERVITLVIEVSNRVLLLMWMQRLFPLATLGNGSILGVRCCLSTTLLSTAYQVLHWDRHHRFCCQCGAPTERHKHEHARVCSRCGYTQYPRISPCIIVAIYRPGEILLGRSPKFPAQVYSTLAGFVEAGERIEAAVHREVYEETKIRIKGLEYIDSQSWPFPHSLMLGFLAQYCHGDVVFDGIEIEDAQWFAVDQLPLMPPAGSISRALITLAVERAGTCQ